MIERQDSVLYVQGDVTVANAAEVEQAGRAKIAGVKIIDLSRVGHVDSSMLAVLTAWVRFCRDTQPDLRIIQPPAALQQLAELYGVQQVLPFGSA